MGEKRDSEEIRILKMLVEKKIFYILIALAFVLFLLTKSFIFAVVVGFLIVLLFVAETLVGISKGGIVNEVKEIVLAVAIALAIWYGSSFLLNTGAPYDAIVSCSMLPNLDRGDLVVLQGAGVNAPEVEISEQEWRSVSNVSVRVGESVVELKEPLEFYCRKNKDSICNLLRSNPDAIVESYGPININWGVCERVKGSQVTQIACAKTLTVKNRTFSQNLSNDIIVYEPLASDYFARSGLIIHRVFLKVKVNGSYRYITKGDNNQVFDMQVGNSPVSQEKVHGKVVARLPFVGYVKLFLSGLFLQPEGCDSTLRNL